VHRVPAIRIRDCNAAPIRESGGYVLYWMIAARRLVSNFALDRALEHCREFRKPLVILEALRCDHRWASERMHRFVLEGMADNAVAGEIRGVSYYPYLEFSPSAGKGLLEALAADATVVITDDFPCFFLPRMVAAAAKRLSVRLEAVDSNGLLPLRAADRSFTTAYSFRRFLQQKLPNHFADFPRVSPLSRVDLPPAPHLPKKITSRWPAANAGLLQGRGLQETALLDRGVTASPIRGGHANARKRLKEFLGRGLSSYREKRNQPELDVASGLSPYLHFGHISAHEILTEIAEHEHWTPEKVNMRADGSREGWWNMSTNAESFLDELVTWREIGYNLSSRVDTYDRFESLPAWALKTLKVHARDEREHLYSLEEFEAGKTYDPLWNAAQMQLVREGRIHNYLRMLWGKKILEWSKSPKEALAILIELNNKYGLDGRDPNSYSGIFWVLGRYDRPWAPERPIYGQIRYMSSANTARKVSVKNYIRKYAPQNLDGTRNKGQATFRF